MDANQLIRRISTTVVVAALVMLVVDLPIRLWGYRLSASYEWAPEDRVPEMEQLQDAGIRSDLLLVGSSTVLVGVRTEEIRSSVPSLWNVHNAGVGAAGPAMVARYLEESLPRLQPKHILWGVASFEFNAQYTDETIIDAFEQTMVGKRGVAGRIDRIMGTWFAIARYRELLRGPLAVTHLFDAARQPRQTDDLLGSGPFPTGRTERKLTIVRDQMLVGYSIDPQKVEEFRSVLTELLAQGIETAVMIMPMPTDYIAAHPRGQQDFDNFIGTIEGVTLDLGIPLLNFSASVEDQLFGDYTHLGEEGATQFSHELANRLIGLGW